MPEKREKIVVEVSGIVSGRDFLPYVLLSIGSESVQMNIAEARNVAMDILQSAYRYEADAMIFKFAKDNGLGTTFAAEMMVAFREFRKGLDSEKVETTTSEPINPEDVFKNAKKV